MPNPRLAPHAFQHSLVTCHGKNLFAANDPLPDDARKRELVREVIQRRAAEQPEIDAHHAAERAAGLDARLPI